MVQVFSVLRPFVYGLMNIAGLIQQKIEIEPGTIMNIWVPRQSLTTSTNIYNPPDKPAILLLHGFALDGAFNWFFHVLTLSGNYSVYVPDALFFGGSVTDKPERTTDFQAEFLSKGMKILGVEKCTVVGLSYGAIIGFSMVKLYPELVKAFVASDGVIQVTESIAEDVCKKFGVATMQELLMPSTLEGTKRMLNAGINSLLPLPNFVYNSFQEVMDVYRQGKIELVEALVIKDEDAYDPKFSQPIHFLWGEDDKIFSLDLARHNKEQLGETATLEYIKNTGHLSAIESPFAYHDRLIEILDSVHKDSTDVDQEHQE